MTTRCAERLSTANMSCLTDLCRFHTLAACFSDSVIRLYNLQQLGRARTNLSKQHRSSRPDAKRQKGPGGERVELEPGIDVDTEASELQVGLNSPVRVSNTPLTFTRRWSSLSAACFAHKPTPPSGG